MKVCEKMYLKNCMKFSFYETYLVCEIRLSIDLEACFVFFSKIEHLAQEFSSWIFSLLTSYYLLNGKSVNCIFNAFWPLLYNFFSLHLSPRGDFTMLICFVDFQVGEQSRQWFSSLSAHLFLSPIIFFSILEKKCFIF